MVKMRLDAGTTAATSAGFSNLVSPASKKIFVDPDELRHFGERATTDVTQEFLRALRW